MSREDGPFVARLSRAPGARESRYVHLFSGMIESVAEPESEPASEAMSGSSAPAGSLAARVLHLETLVDQLRAELDALKERAG